MAIKQEKKDDGLAGENYTKYMNTLDVISILKGEVQPKGLSMRQTSPMVTPDLPHGSFDWLTFPRDDLDMHLRDWFLAREPGCILKWDFG